MKITFRNVSEHALRLRVRALWIQPGDLFEVDADQVEAAPISKWISVGFIEPVDGEEVD